jgi:hypothetical protein
MPLEIPTGNPLFWAAQRTRGLSDTRTSSRPKQKNCDERVCCTYGTSNLNGGLSRYYWIYVIYCDTDCDIKRKRKN